MALTEEQRERIRMNRERAMEIRMRKAEETARAESKTSTSENEEDSKIKSKSKNIHAMENKNNLKTETRTRGKEPDETIELEDFEEHASPFVTKHEAMKTYCLPMGTLDVCEFVEKPNPRNPRFSSMKLYHRSEIRRRARERYGGLEGLIKERKQRERKRLEKDLEDVHDIFQTDAKRSRKAL